MIEIISVIVYGGILGSVVFKEPIILIIKELRTSKNHRP